MLSCVQCFAAPKTLPPPGTLLRLSPSIRPLMSRGGEKKRGSPGRMMDEKLGIGKKAFKEATGHKQNRKGKMVGEEKKIGVMGGRSGIRGAKRKGRGKKKRGEIDGDGV